MIFGYFHWSGKVDLDKIVLNKLMKYGNSLCVNNFTNIRTKLSERMAFDFKENKHSKI